MTSYAIPMCGFPCVLPCSSQSHSRPVEVVTPARAAALLAWLGCQHSLKTRQGKSNTSAGWSFSLCLPHAGCRAGLSQLGNHAELVLLCCVAGVLAELDKPCSADMHVSNCCGSAACCCAGLSQLGHHAEVVMLDFAATLLAELASPYSANPHASRLVQRTCMRPSLCGSPAVSCAGLSQLGSHAEVVMLDFAATLLAKLVGPAQPYSANTHASRLNQLTCMCQASAAHLLCLVQG